MYKTYKGIQYLKPTHTKFLIRILKQKRRQVKCGTWAGSYSEVGWEANQLDLLGLG